MLLEDYDLGNKSHDTQDLYDRAISFQPCQFFILSSEKQEKLKPSRKQKSFGDKYE